LEEIKAQLGITGNAQDAALTANMRGTLTLIENYLGRGIVERATPPQVFEPPDTRDPRLFLTRFPVAEILSVIIKDGAPIPGWRLFATTGVLELGYGCGDWWRYPREGCCPAPTIVVDYIGGYPQDCWPPDLLEAVMRTFYGRWNASGGNIATAQAGGPVKSWSADGLAIVMGDSTVGLGEISDNVIPADILNVAAMLDPYRVRFVRGM
jgi:hypothetical protein